MTQWPAPASNPQGPRSALLALVRALARADAEAEYLGKIKDDPTDATGQPQQQEAQGPK